MLKQRGTETLREGGGRPATGEEVWGTEPPQEILHYGKYEILLANFKDPFLVAHNVMQWMVHVFGKKLAKHSITAVSKIGTNVFSSYTTIITLIRIAPRSGAISITLSICFII